MLHTIRLAAVTFAALSLLGCAGAQSAGKGEYAYGASEEWRLKTLEEKALEQRNAQMELAGQVTALSRRVEALEQKAAGAPAGPAPLMSSQDLPEPGPKMAETPAKPAPAKPMAEGKDKAKAGAEWDAYPDATAKAKAAAKAAAPAKSQPKAPAAKSAAPAPKSAKAAPASAQAEYDRALALVMAGKDAEGRAAFEAFLAKHPGGALSPNARYWLGETFYHEKNYADSIVAFKKVHQEYPRHDKAAAALLKIGYAYALLGDTANARFYLQVLTQDYPSSEPSALARKRLDTLK